MRLTIALLCLILIVSCKKDGDTEPPAIMIMSPVDGAQYGVGDAVHVVLEIADNVELADVEVKLTDANLVPVMPTEIIATSGDGGTLELDYYLDDISILSGQYYIHATVHDAARNSETDYALLNITEVPLELKGIFAVTTLPGVVSVHAIDSTWGMSSLGAFNGDFTDAAVNSYWQQLTFTGSVNGQTQCIPLANYAGWTINPFPSAGPYWGNVLAHERDWLINYRADGIIKACTWNGTISSSYIANSGFVFRNFAFSGDKMFADQVDATGTSRIMGVYIDGGGAVQQTSLSIDPIAIIPRDELTVYVAGNLAGQGKLLIYDYDLNGTWEPIALPAGKLLSIAQINANTLLLAMDNGSIFRFTYAPVGVITWHSASAQHVRYDAAGGTVVTAEGSDVKQYGYPGTSILDQISLSDSVRDIELWYNR